MYQKLSSWLSLIAFLALFIAQAAAQGPAALPSSQVAGDIRATRVVGKVTYQDIATSVTKDMAVDNVIRQGSIVRTAANSSVVLLFSNGATINLASDTELNILTFTQDPFAGNYEPAKATDEPSISTTNILLTQGELVGNVKKLKRGGPVESKFTVGTPVGAAGIRGTTFKIVYRPTGNGRTFNFVLTTIEGDVEVQVAGGTVNAPPVSVTDNKEVILSNVEVNAAGQVVVTTATGQSIPVTAAPASTDAPVLTVTQVQAIAQQLAQSIADKVLTAPTPAPPVNPPSTNTTPPPDNNQPPPENTPTPGTTTPPRVDTNPR